MVQLGDYVRDTVSGFEGIAVSRHSYLHGCHRITIQPKVSDGKLPESETFDEPQLEVINPADVEVEPEPAPTRRGGPMPYVDKGRHP